MKPGRIYYNVDLTPDEIKLVFPYLDFETDLLVINGYGDEVFLLPQCPRCGLDIDNEGVRYKRDLDNSKDIYGVERYRCPRCHEPIDDQWYYTGCEDIGEACQHIFNDDDYRGYQIWPKDAATMIPKPEWTDFTDIRRKDVAHYRTDHLVETGYRTDFSTGHVECHYPWLYRDIENWEEFKAERDAIFAPVIEDPERAYNIEAYDLESFKEQLDQVLADED